MPQPASPAQDSAAIDRWMKSLFGSTRETAVIVLSPGGTILAWLGAAAVLFGYPESEAIGMPLTSLFTEEDVVRGLDVQERELALSSGRSEDDRWHVRRDGSRFWGSGVMETIRDDDGHVVALAKVLRDRTDVRTQVVALQNRLLSAEEQNLGRLRSLAAIAHELRNQASPLGNLVALLETGKAPATTLPTMRRQVGVLARLLDDLAEQSAVASDRPSLAFGEVAVQSLVQHAAQAIGAEVDQRGQTLKVTVPAAAIVLQADEHRVDQMLFNLLSNASKFTPAGGTIQISATVEDDMVAIRVEDDGDGIATDVLPRIFELFTREERAGAPHGLGVGLAVVRTLAELHGGFVEARSPGRGKGSIFAIRLPLVQPGQPPA